MPDRKPRVITVPKTPRRAFNPERPPSDLLLHQIRHLEWAARPASVRRRDEARRSPQKSQEGRSRGQATTVRTERAAAERIAYLTRLVLDSKFLPAGTTGGKPAAAKVGRGRRTHK